MRDWRSEIRERLSSLNLAPSVEADIVEEIAQHLEDELIEACSRGEDAEQATSRFLNTYDAAELQRVIRERRSARASLLPPPIGAQSRARGWIDAMRRDVVYGWRSLWRSKGATLAIILSLAIVIGANTAIFGLVDAMFLRRLPLPKAAELVEIVPTNDGYPVSVPYTKYKLLKSAAAMPPVEAYRFEGAEVVTPANEHADMWIDVVTGGYFQLLGVKPLVGRMLNAEDDRDAVPVAVVSQEFLTRYFGGRTDVLGRTLKLNDMVVTIVGVTAPSFTGINFARHFQVAIPFTLSLRGSSDLSQTSVSMIARMNGTGGRAAQAALIDRIYHSCCLNVDDIASSIGVARPSGLRTVNVDDPPLFAIGAERTPGTGFRMQLDDASTGLRWGVDFRARYRDVLFATMGAVLLLLLIACANVGTLLLARGQAREREFAVRRSLGASAARIKMQLLIEGLELAFVGSVLGFAFAIVGTRLLMRALPTSAAPLGGVIAWRSTGTIVGFTAAVMILCAIVTNLWPARRAGREELLGSLTGARRRVARGWGADRVLVVAQVTLAIVLTTAASLYVSTVHNLTKGGRGYGSRSVLLGVLNPIDRSGDGATFRAAYSEMLRKAQTLPGAETAVLAFNAPVFQDALTMPRVHLPGSLEDGLVTTRGNIISPGFFSVTGVGLAEGRDFSTSDDALAPPVIIVSSAFEHRYYGNRSALGQTVVIDEGKTTQLARIVGVARDAGYDRLGGQGTNLRDLLSEMIYMPMTQYPFKLGGMTLIIRTAGDPIDLVAPLRHLADGTTGITVRRITSVGQLLNDAASRERFAAALATGFGVLALILTAVGVFGVLWFHVSQRTKEIGIRMALGAQPADAMRLVLRQSLSMTALAVVLGVPLAVACTWVVRAQFYGVKPAEPLALIGSAALLTAIGVIASVVPSRHAARVDPLVALREDG